MSNFYDIQIWKTPRGADDHENIVMFFENYRNGDDVWAELHPDGELWVYDFDDNDDSDSEGRAVEKITLREFLERVLSK